MKHIIIVLHSLAVGGAERHLTTVANYFSLKGMSAEINERGDYTRNHIDWRIWEKTLSV